MINSFIKLIIRHYFVIQKLFTERDEDYCLKSYGIVLNKLQLEQLLGKVCVSLWNKLWNSLENQHKKKPDIKQFTFNLKEKLFLEYKMDQQKS